jgi:hypothetical protein
MPIRPFKCSHCHKTLDVVLFGDDDKSLKVILCNCGKIAHRVEEVQLPARRNPDYGIQK